MQAGDTLEAIALQVWGDAGFWYLIADANGLDGTEVLVEGMSLVIPNKVHNAHNNAGTYRVYDPNEAIGDTAPTVPKVKRRPSAGWGSPRLSSGPIRPDRQSACRLFPKDRMSLAPPTG